MGLVNHGKADAIIQNILYVPHKTTDSFQGRTYLVVLSKRVEHSFEVLCSNFLIQPNIL